MFRRSKSVVSQWLVVTTVLNAIVLMILIPSLVISSVAVYEFNINDKCTYDNCAATSTRRYKKDCISGSCEVIKNITGACDVGEECLDAQSSANYAFNSVCYVSSQTCNSVSSSLVSSANIHVLETDTIYRIPEDIAFTKVSKKIGNKGNVYIKFWKNSGVAYIDLSNVTLESNGYPWELMPVVNSETNDYKPMGSFIFALEGIYDTVGETLDSAVVKITEDLRIVLDKPGSRESGFVTRYNDYIVDYPLSVNL
jgi:hypothetical protein